MDLVLVSKETLLEIMNYHCVILLMLLFIRCAENLM
nr:MAG TPA: hypothetical protein [Caudoviricetes sp.]